MNNMNSTTDFNMGLRQVWSYRGLAIKGFIGSVLILIGIQTTQAQSQSSDKSWYFGIAGGANINFYRGTTQRLNSDLKVSTAFQNGNGIGMYVAPLIEFHQPDTRFGFMLQAGIDSRKGKFKEVTTPCNCPADLSTDLSYFTVEPSLRIAPFKSDFYLYIGPRFAFNMRESFTYEKGINPANPEQVAKPAVTGDFSDLKKNLISFQIGAGFDIPLSLQFMTNQPLLSPFISFHPYFGQHPRSIESWNVTTVRLGAALKFGGL